MDIKKYEVLLQAIDCGSLTRAGEELGYTQSGVSNLIKSLENEIGFPLLLRQRTGILPTTNGACIIPILRELVKRNEQLNQVTASIIGMEIGTIRIGTFTSMSVQWLPLIIKQFQSDFPNISIKLMEGGNQELSAWIEAGQVDLGFCNYQVHQNFDWIPLIDDSLMAVLPKGHPMEKKEFFPLMSFNGEPFIMLPPDFDYEVHLIFDQNNIVPDVKFSSMDDYTIISMVEQGLGLSILPKLVLKGYLHCQVSTLELEPYCPRTLGIALASIKNASPAAKKFITYAQSIISYEAHI